MVAIIKYVICALIGGLGLISSPILLVTSDSDIWFLVATISACLIIIPFPDDDDEKAKAKKERR